MVDSDSQSSKKRTRVSRPYPQHRLGEVLEIARSIQEKNAGLPFDRVRLAKSMGTTPASSAFMMKLNSSAKYGLTEGGYSDARISLTELGIRAAQDQPDALVEAGTRPDTFRSFYELLDGKRIPGPEEASGIIVDDIGIPESLASEFLEIVVGNGVMVGIVTDIGSSHYVSLGGPSGEEEPELDATPTVEHKSLEKPPAESPTDVQRLPEDLPLSGSRLLVVHSGAGAIADRVVRMLDDLGIPHAIVEIDPIDSSPLSTEWSREMNGCAGAIVVMAGPSRVVSTPGVASSRTSKMLLQLGAAVDRFRDRVVMIVGTDGDHFLQTVRVQRVHVDGEDAGKFEMDLLRGLIGAEMMVVSVPSHSS